MIEKAGTRSQRDEAVENSRLNGQFDLKPTSASGVSCVTGKKERNRRKRPESKYPESKYNEK